MNYACRSNRLFVTEKDLPVKTKLSAEAKSKRDFIRSHKFSVNVNPSTQETRIEVSER